MRILSQEIMRVPNYCKKIVNKYWRPRYKGNSIHLFLTVVIAHVQQVNRYALILFGGLISTSVLMLRFDSKYAMFTAEFSNVISNFALNVSLVMFQLITIYAIIWLFNKFRYMLQSMWKDMFYESRKGSY